MIGMYRRILVPMENELQQEPALAHAQMLAQHTRATVVLAWLVPVLASEERFFSQIQVEPGSSGARRKEQGEIFVAQAAQRFQEIGIPVEPKIMVTPLPPEEAIVHMAVEEDIDLIVMATLSESAVGRFLFGSVAEKVRRRSPIPVLFVNPSEMEGGGA
jgi:nucleotide-binding universal stress UspA family protein